MAAPPKIDNLLDQGYLIEVPTKWLLHARTKHGGRVHAFIALKPLTLGTRRVRAGDILAEHEETNALEGMLLRHDIAELPIDGGIVGLLRLQLARVAELERELAKARTKN